MPTDEPHGKHVETTSRIQDESEPGIPSGTPRDSWQHHCCRWCKAEWYDEDAAEHEDDCPVADLAEALEDLQRAKQSVETQGNAAARRWTILRDALELLDEVRKLQAVVATKAQSLPALDRMVARIRTELDT